MSWRRLGEDNRWSILIALVALAIQVVHLLSLPVREQITFIPDDTFYYLTLGRHFASSGVWTFDGGVSQTNGFHLLHAYACASLFAIAPGIGARAAIAVLAILGAALATGATVVLARAASKAFGEAAGPAIVLVATSATFLTQAHSGMEWPWVVLAAALLMYSFGEGGRAPCFAAGLACTLARSDGALLAPTLVAAALWVRWRRGDRAYVGPALFALAGASLGVALVCAHGALTVGEPLQSSARIKAHWAAFTGYDLRASAQLGVRTASPGYLMIEGLGRSFRAVAFAYAAALAALFWLSRRLRPAPAPPVTAAAAARREVLGVAALLSAVGYAAVYATSPAALQPWYTASFVVPLVLLHAWAFCAVWTRDVRAITVALSVALAAHGVKAAREPMFPSQVYMFDAADWLSRQDLGARVGAWNAGTIAFFSRRDVINIDGLVNNDIVPYVLADRLPCYLRERDVRYVLDWQTMLEGRNPRRGGYSGGLIAPGAAPLYVVPGTEQPTGVWHHLSLFRVDPDAPSAAGCAPPPRN